MQKSICCLVLISFSLVVDCLEEEEWKKWKDIHGKFYESFDEEMQRMKIWSQNKLMIDKHNSEEHSFTMTMNKFGDLSPIEFIRRYGGYRVSSNLVVTHKFGEHITNIPDEVDWRTKGVVSPIKNQGSCGSCWAFSITGVLESHRAIETGKMITLSEQQLLDCSISEFTHGCNGGVPAQALIYVSNMGIESEMSYPYMATNGTCQYNASRLVAGCKWFKRIEFKNETALAVAVATVGPVSVSIDASYLQFYKGGVVSGSNCKGLLDHAVLVIGYNSYNNTEAWIVKNSWGEDWGMNGYFLLARNADSMCGIADFPVYPTGVF